MRLAQLRSLLSEWGEACTGCLEKSDFVAKAAELRVAKKKSSMFGFEL